MKIYYYIEPDNDFFPIGHYVTQRYILEYYFPYWCGKMCEVGKYDLITFERCVKDFIVVNWAEEIK